MDIRVQEDEKLVRISVAGDVEMITIKTFKQKLLEVGQNMDKDIDVDLSGVDYIDSSGVGVLISLLKIQKKKGKNLFLSKLSPRVQQIFKLSSLAEVFNIVTT